MVLSRRGAGPPRVLRTGPDGGAALSTEEAEGEDHAELFYGSVDEFVREVILPMYQRKVGPRSSRRWSAEWWRSAEAVSRLDALWRAWEHLRLDGALGMSTWWRDHADYHMNILFPPDGPFGRSEDENKPGAPLPYTPPRRDCSLTSARGADLEAK